MTNGDRRDRPRWCYLGKRVKELRERSGLSLGDVGKRVGCSRSYIYSIEQSTKWNLSLGFVGRLAAALEVPLVDLLREPAGGIESTEDEYLADLLQAWSFLSREDREELSWRACKRASWIAVRDQADLEPSGAMSALSAPSVDLLPAIPKRRRYLMPGRPSQPRTSPLRNVFDVARGFEVPSECVEDDIVIRRNPDETVKIAVKRYGEFVRDGGTSDPALLISRLMPILWRPCVSADDLRPLGPITPTRSVILVPGSDDHLKASFLKTHEGSLVIWDPRTLVATIIPSTLAFPRVLYVAAPKPGTGMPEDGDLCCRRLAMLINSNFWPRMMPAEPFFRRSVIPPVSVFRNAPVPGELFQSTSRTEELDRLGLEVAAWASEAKGDSGLKPFDQHLAWRRAMPHLTRVTELLLSMME